MIGQWYFLVVIIDAYSRYSLAWDLCWTFTGYAMGLFRQSALGKTPGAKPEIVSDNGPEFVNRNFVTMLKAQGLKEIWNRIHHRQSNGVLERYHRTFREEGWAGQHRGTTRRPGFSSGSGSTPTTTLDSTVRSTT